MRAAEQDRPGVRQRREAWRAGQAGWEPHRLVFLDEFGVTTDMTPRYGRAPRGERVLPAGHYAQTSVIASMRLEGAGEAMSLPGAIDTKAFVTFVRRRLAPTLQAGDVVVMDDLSAHEAPDVAEAIASAGARVLDPPPYSPDLNPIAKMIAKVKQWLRSAKARTQEALNRAWGEALRTVTARNAAGYFARCGYPTDP